MLIITANPPRLDRSNNPAIHYQEATVGFNYLTLRCRGIMDIKQGPICTGIWIDHRGGHSYSIEHDDFFMPVGVRSEYEQIIVNHVPNGSFFRVKRDKRKLHREALVTEKMLALGRFNVENEGRWRKSVFVTMKQEADRTVWVEIDHAREGGCHSSFMLPANPLAPDFLAKVADAIEADAHYQAQVQRSNKRLLSVL